MMRKYLCIILLFIAAAGSLRAQTLTAKLVPLRLAASFERVKESLPNMAGQFVDSKMKITALESTDSTASFEIEEQGISIETVVDNEKDYNKLVAAAAKDVSKPSIHLLYTYILNNKKLKVPPPRKIFFAPEYGVLWTLIAKKVAEKETEIALHYKSLSPAFAEKIESEFESDSYYSHKIVKINVNDKRMRNLINEVLINQMHVDRDYPAPTYPARN
ncbi:MULTISPECIES: transcriptional regulator [Sphingobacterium]|uniref:transcriptional regulator n=1 Tax=Sphingobacterium TaxID=28453 RepID=UPI00257F5311|nr:MULTISPECIES: transcriptional regulator [Sphingobacterium]